MNLLDKIASWLGYMPINEAIQGSIAFREDTTRAHVVLQIDGMTLIGEVDCFQDRERVPSGMSTDGSACGQTEI